MNLFQITWKNIQGSVFRSWIIVICAALMAGFSTSAAFLVRGAQDSLDLTLDRLGADIIIVPKGTAPMMETAFLMGVPTQIWMDDSVVDDVRSVEGVEIASAQLFLSTLRGATCCSVPEMFMVAYDPETDFTLTPWLKAHIKGSLAVGDVVGGEFVYVPADQDRIYVYGYGTNLRGNLEATGTGLDQTMFFTFDTAYEISRLSEFQAERKMDIPIGQVSSVLVKVSPDADPATVASNIRKSLPNVSVVENANMFSSQKDHITNLIGSVLVVLGITWILSMALIGLIFTVATNERRRQIGVLRALGATRAFILNTLLAEGAFLALSGAVSGIVLCMAVLLLFKNLIVQTLNLPIYLPSLATLLLWGLLGLLFTLASVLLSALLPAWRISNMDPSIAMRE